ncbi:lariat debranching enzyme, C-terminal domain-containing protein [Xylariaceae sp. FL0255]|nr:lariat debranching enzyme, C-terminal domain-containing protein [Xylariaceae sp. FL0255]
MASSTFETEGVRVAIEGCGHGTLDAIYGSVATASKAQGWDGVDLLIIGGDFQAARNAADLSVMAVPAKYRALGDFPAYYSGEKTAPYLTVFIAGNHEASSYLWELYYGGWVAPNIYYLGAANVLRFGPLRIASMSGIWKGHDYRKPHHERLPFDQGDIRSFYHVREIDVRKLLLLREQVDVGMSHDWPRAIENHGDAAALWRMKPDFRQESVDGTLGSPAVQYVMDRLRPAYWFSAHMHCKFSAIKTYQAPSLEPASTENSEQAVPNDGVATTAGEATANPDEIDLDDDDDDLVAQEDAKAAGVPQPTVQPASTVSDELRAKLPASFAAPTSSTRQGPKTTPGQPVPSSIQNTTTRFMALDKCLPGRKFIQLSTLQPVDSANLVLHPPGSTSTSSLDSSKQRYKLQYDPEWLAITRVFANIGIFDSVPQDLGEAAYNKKIDVERAWVDEHIVGKDKLAVPENFSITAPPHVQGDPETVNYQPEEYTNPQTVAFCELLEIPNHWDATPEERAERKANAPTPSTENHRGGSWGGRGRHGGSGRGRGFGRGSSRARGHGRGRGGGWH